MNKPATIVLALVVSFFTNVKAQDPFSKNFEGLAGKYAEPTGGKVELRKSDDAKREAGPWRFVLSNGSTQGDWACAPGEDRSGEGKPSVFTITFSEGPFKGSRYIIVRGQDGKVNEVDPENRATG